MKVTRIVLTSGQTTYMRDAEERGNFLCGVECNAWGVSSRTDGCANDPELMVRLDRLTSVEELA